MATENILVEHSNIPTAAFDLINRKLLLPNWKNISDNVYTLLISHEVGHALYTPTEEWDKEILKTKDSSLKQVVNIIEDVRIEKLIQQKYPGTVRAFRSGYDQLEKMNLFGTQSRNIESYGLLDRLNLHFKLGHYGYATVPFSTEESIWIEKISNCKTFSDVLKVAADLKKYVEEHPESQGEKNQESGDGTSDKNQNSESQDSQDSQASRSDQFESSDAGQGAQQSGGEEDDLSGDTPQNSDAQKFSTRRTGKVQTIGKSAPLSASEVRSETQKHFDAALSQLVDKSVLDTVYVNFPKLDLSKFIIPYKTVHGQISSYYSTYYPDMLSSIETKIAQFKNTSKTVVNQLANIFEMKKRARLDVKALTSPTGKLDTNKVHSYRYNDDIFKKITVVPQGKSHGLVMFIDMSSSMYDSISGTIEQLLNLVLFCRRANIPFEVYGFTDAPTARGTTPAQYSRPGELALSSSFCLRQYFTNRMSGTEFNTALGNMLCLMQYYLTTGQGYRSGLRVSGIPSEESLNTTPLVPAILCALDIVKVFKAQNSIDIVNTIFLTDGDDTHGLMYNDNTEEKVFRGFYRNAYTLGAQAFYLRDIKTRQQWQIKDSTPDMLNILRETAGVKVIGFHIVKKRDAQNIILRHTKPGQQDKQLSTFKNEKFCELNNIPGYDAYYLLPGGSGLSVGEDEFRTAVDTTVDWDDDRQAKRAMKAVQKDFNNFMKNRVTSRVLLNRFIDHIS